MARKKKGNPVNGWLCLDKPLGLTSTQAIGRVRRLLNPKKIGHAGTLDPLASGILPIALGEATKTVPYVQDSSKRYIFTVRWGEQRSTDDAEGEVTASSDHRPEDKEIKAALPGFIGEIEQVPPAFSALKIDGQRAYDLARAGEEVVLKSRCVQIYDFTFLRSDKGEAEFEVHCGKGTYVRSLARDLGLKLGTYGYVSALRRTQVGFFTQENSISLDKLEKIEDSAARLATLLPIRTALDDIPAFELKQDEVVKLRNGQVLSLISKPDFERLKMLREKMGADDNLALGVYQEREIALLEIKKAQVHPLRVFNL